MITEINLLTAEECLNVCSIVHELKKFWIQRHLLFPFYTLGAASPYDVPVNKQGYYQKAKYFNAILNNSLELLYVRLANSIVKQLGMPVSYPANLALPGFHIFLSHPVFEQPVGAIHCDKSYMFHWQPAEGVDFNHPLSFTLAVRLPTEGGGMTLWDLPYEEVKGLNHSEIEQLASTRQNHFHPYTVGTLLLHSGLIVHQIAPGKNLQSDDERITLQGHALLCKGSWQLHW